MKKKDLIGRPNCGQCAAFDDQTESGDPMRWGLCRLWPAVPLACDGEITMVLPQKAADEWCMQFEAKQ